MKDSLINTIEQYQHNSTFMTEVSNAVKKAVDNVNQRKQYLCILENDQAFDTFVKNFTSYNINAPVVRASVYNNEISADQEIETNLTNLPRYHPRRPVIMRGGLKLMINKTGHADNYCYNIIERYLRIRKYNCINTQSNKDLLKEIEARLRNRQLPEGPKYRLSPRKFDPASVFTVGQDHCVNYWGKWSFWLAGIYYTEREKKPGMKKFRKQFG